MNLSNKHQQEKPAKIPLNYCQNCRSTDCKRLCIVNCLSCHEQHRYKDMENRMCPNIARFGQRLVYNRSFECPKCKGRGNYLKVKELIVSQLNENYQKRLEIWRSKKNYDLEDQQSQQWLKPVLKTSKKVIHEKFIMCRLCTNGRIYRMRNCCPNGCSKCKYQRAVISRRWQKLRSKLKYHNIPVPFPEELKEIACQMCSKYYVAGESVYQMECLHGFHSDCVRKNFERNMYNCPLCELCEPVYFRQELCIVNTEEEIKVQEGEEIDLSERDLSFSSIDPEDDETQIRESEVIDFDEEDY